MPIGRRLNWLLSGRGAALETVFRRSLIVAGLIAVVLTVGLQFAQVYDLRMDSYTRRLRVAAQLSAEQVAQFIESHQAALALVPGQNAPDEEWSHRVVRLKEQFPAFDLVAAQDQAGRISYGKPEGLESMGCGGRTLGAPMSNVDRFVSDAFKRVSDGAASFALVVPIDTTDGAVDGRVCGSIRASQLGRIHGSPLKDRGILFLVVDRNDRVIYASESLAVHSLDRLKSPLPTIAGGRAPIVNGLLEVDGATAYVSKAVTPFGWTVAVVHPASILRSEFRSDLLAILGPAVLVVAATVWVASLLARRLSAPIRNLSGRMRDCHLEDSPIELGDQPMELDELGRSFNALISRVNRSREKAKQAERDLIRTVKERDETIAARTAELKRVNEELRVASLTDALTGCRNYRGLTEDMARLVRQCDLEDAPMGVITTDIDLFKQYNDRYGHPAGDACLQRVASAMRGALFSSGDALARAGGEEFVALLPRLPARATQTVAERMRASVAALGIPHADSPFGIVTVSVGWGVHLASDNSEVEQVMMDADAALYVAKELGRNRVAGSRESGGS